MRVRSGVYRPGFELRHARRAASAAAFALSLALAAQTAPARAQQQPSPQQTYPNPQQPRPTQPSAQQPPSQLPPSQRPRPAQAAQPNAQQQQPTRQTQPQQPGAAGGGNLDRLISGVGPVCLRAPARQCVDLGFAYADRNRDQRLSLPETRAVHDEVNAWARDNAPKLPPAERQRLVTGLLVIQTVGPDALFESYDTNRDGALTKEEALADVRLDQRPLPQVLSDPNAVDWRRLTDRAGMAAPLLKRLFPM
jgi:type IV secretory pathway VirB10-like protein